MIEFKTVFHEAKAKAEQEAAEAARIKAEQEAKAKAEIEKVKRGAIIEIFERLGIKREALTDDLEYHHPALPIAVKIKLNYLPERGATRVEVPRATAIERVAYGERKYDNFEYTIYDYGYEVYYTGNLLKGIKNSYNEAHEYDLYEPGTARPSTRVKVHDDALFNTDEERAHFKQTAAEIGEAIVTLEDWLTGLEDRIETYKLAVYHRNLEYRLDEVKRRLENDKEYRDRNLEYTTDEVESDLIDAIDSLALQFERERQARERNFKAWKIAEARKHDAALDLRETIREIVEYEVKRAVNEAIDKLGAALDTTIARRVEGILADRYDC